MLSDVFIRRPILATVCSLRHHPGRRDLPSRRCRSPGIPELAPPPVTVSAFYTGANAQAVESAVTTPLEQVINGVEGMTYITSSSTNSGVSTITVTFDIGRDPDLAAVDVQNRVNQALGRMPAEVRTNGITVTKQTRRVHRRRSASISEDNRYDALFISNYLDVYVRDAIKRVPGVGNVIIFGERKYAMRLWLDPGASWRRAASPPATSSTRCASRTCRSPPARVGDAPADAGPDVSRSACARRAG